jgi:hypothetical protein
MAVISADQEEKRAAISVIQSVLAAYEEGIPYGLSRCKIFPDSYQPVGPQPV